MSAPLDLLACERHELQQVLASWGEPRYRATQLWQWLYASLVSDPQEMTNLPLALRRRLADEVVLSPLSLVDLQAGDDGLTEKALLQARDGQRLETVLMRYVRRNSVCVSTQIGCAIGCPFCATGQGGFVRDLSVSEIVDQVLFWARRLRAEEQAVTHVVFMGMGEPLLNLEALLGAVRRLHDSEGMALGMRRMTVSTAGVVPGIERLVAEGLALGLAVSLHAADDGLRDRLVPLNRKYPLASLLAATEGYAAASGRRVTYEYALVAGVNDDAVQARRLGHLLRGTLGHVNLIALNPTPGCPWRPSEPALVQRFRDLLAEARIPVTIRQSRGAAIGAACGQLRAGRAEGDRQP